MNELIDIILTVVATYGVISLTAITLCWILDAVIKVVLPPVFKFTTVCVIIWLAWAAYGKLLGGIWGD